MKLYVNTVPFAMKWDHSYPVFEPVGTTFAAMGADFHGVILKQVKKINEGDDSEVLQSVSPELLKAVFKEVEQIEE